MGFEKIVKIPHVRGACKRQDALEKIKAELEEKISTCDGDLPTGGYINTWG
ncbi:hypothetical protein P3L10_030856 [Capsicum annuum]